MQTIYLKLIAVPILWGGTFIAGRVASAELPPLGSGFLRFVFASLTLLFAVGIFEKLTPFGKLNWRQWLGTALLGATGIFVYNLCFFSALAIISASRTSLFVALNPVMTTVLAYLVLREPVTKMKALGIGVALIGVWIVVTRGDLSQLMAGFGRGELFMLCAVFSWAVYTLINRWLLQAKAQRSNPLSVLQMVCLAACWGAIFLGLACAFQHPEIFTFNRLSSISTKTWVSLAFLGILGTAVAFVWYAQGLSKLGAARTVIFNNLVPVFGVLLGWLILKEPLSLSLLIGGAMAVTGVFLVNR